MILERVKRVVNVCKKIISSSSQIFTSCTTFNTEDIKSVVFLGLVSLVSNVMTVFLIYALDCHCVNFFLINHI